MIEADKNSIVTTIAGQVNIPQGVGTVKWSWKDNNGEIHTHLIEHVYYFPASLITAFARQLADEESTGVDTTWKTSMFYWKGGYQRTLQHPISQLPEMALTNLQESQFANFTNDFCVQIDDSISFNHSSCYTCSNVCTSLPSVFQWKGI